MTTYHGQFMQTSEHLKSRLQNLLINQEEMTEEDKDELVMLSAVATIEFAQSISHNLAIIASRLVRIAGSS